MVGYAYVAGDLYTHAFITPANGGPLKDLGTLGGNISYAVAMNDTGQVAGTSVTSGGYRHAFLYDPQKGMQDLLRTCAALTQHWFSNEDEQKTMKLVSEIYQLCEIALGKRS